MRKIYTSIIIFILLFGLSPGLGYAKDYSMTIDYLIKLGKNHYNKGNYTDSVTEFKKCLLTEPNCATCQEYLIASENILEKKQQMIKAAFKETIKTKEEPIEKSVLVKPPKKSEPLKPKEQKPKDVSPAKKDIIPGVQRGAWTVPKGKLYCELYNKYYWYKSYFDDKGKRVEWPENANYDEIMTSLKFEYGLTDNLSYLLELPYKRMHWHDDNGKFVNRGLADIWTGLKYCLLRDPVVFSVQTRIKIPTHYNEHHTPSLGRRQVDGELRFLMGKSLWPMLLGYTKAEAGFRARNEEPTNEIIYYYELGYNLTKGITLKGAIDGVEGISGTGKVDEDYTKWLFSTIFNLIGNINLEVGYGQTFAGKNSSAAEEVIATLSTLF